MEESFRAEFPFPLPSHPPPMKKSVLLPIAGWCWGVGGGGGMRQNALFYTIFWVIFPQSGPFCERSLQPSRPSFDSLGFSPPPTPPRLVSSAGRWHFDRDSGLTRPSLVLLLPPLLSFPQMYSLGEGGGSGKCPPQSLALPAGVARRGGAGPGGDVRGGGGWDAGGEPPALLHPPPPPHPGGCNAGSDELHPLNALCWAQG